MKHLQKTLSILIIAITLIFFGISPVFAESLTTTSSDVNSFYFDSFDADYYLEKDSEGISHLKVIETLTAVFPESNQNHGIERVIPFVNQDGKNITLETLNKSNLSVKRNGQPEPFSITKSSSTDYTVRIGSADSFVHGRQEYEIEYTFTNVITEFSENNKSWQELYWDTNGTGWHQSFNTLTARIHFAENIKDTYSGESWCYVGKYGQSGQDRCKIIKIDDGVMFETTNLSPTENLTFVSTFSPNTFKVPEIQKSYIVLVYMGVELILIIFLVFLTLKVTKTSRNNKKEYKSIFVNPEYQVPKDLTVQEAGILSVKTLRSPQVATLIGFAVNGNIELIKGEKKLFGGNKWQVKIISLDGISATEKIVLDLLNGGDPVEEGQVIDIKRRAYNTSASLLAQSIPRKVKKSLKEKNFLSRTKTNGKMTAVIVFSILIAVLSPVLLTFLVDSVPANKIILFGDLAPLCVLVPFLFAFINIVSIGIISKYDKYTKNGLKKSRELEGLELFIRMTEKDRLAFFQSVENVDTSHQGIVNLYEKLLPYAILFGVEDSWLEELNKYYQFEDVRDTYWYHNGIIFVPTDLRAFNTSASSSISSVSASSASSTSSSSSFSSGSGGGGFSGGGGGGGGGGGW